MQNPAAAEREKRKLSTHLRSPATEAMDVVYVV